MTVGEGEHPLQCPYAFWFSRRAPGKLQAAANYADNIKLVGKFASVSLLFSLPFNLANNEKPSKPLNLTAMCTPRGF